MVRSTAASSFLGLLLGCTSVDSSAPGSEGSGGSTGADPAPTTGLLTTASSGSTAADSSTGASSSSEGGAETDDSIQPPEVAPPDCDSIELDPQSLAAWQTERGVLQGVALHPGGEATVLVGDSIIQFGADGEPADTLQLDAGLHPTTIASDGMGNLFVAGTLDVTLQGDVHGFVRRYVGQQLARHTELALESGANERPVSLAAAPGYIAVMTSVEYDALSGGSPDFNRLDRLDSSLELVRSEPAGLNAPRHAIDDEGTTYFLAAADTLTALGLDGEILWSSTITAAGQSVSLSVGASSVWVAKREGPGGGSIRSFDRVDGTPRVSVDLSAQRGRAELETPAALAAHPCGGASLLATASSEDEESISLSHIAEDGTRNTTPLPFAPGQPNVLLGGDAFFASTAADGGSLALFPVDDEHQWVGF